MNETCRNDHGTHSGGVVLNLYAASPVAGIQERNIQTAFLSTQTTHRHTKSMYNQPGACRQIMCGTINKSMFKLLCFSGWCHKLQLLSVQTSHISLY